MSKDIGQFTGGTSSAREKLNAIRDIVNALDQIKGDGLIVVQRTPAGLTIRLAMDRVLERIPKYVPPYQLIPVLLELENPSDIGSDTIDCAFTYTLTDLKGGILYKEPGVSATGMIPLKRRIPLTEYVVPGSGEAEYGLAFYDENDELLLWDANELPASEDCDASGA